MKYSLIIPVYNEAQVIVDSLRLLTASMISATAGTWEIIVVDNASTDSTSALMLEARLPHVRVIRIEEKGKGRAIRAGFRDARGDIVGFTDADLSVSPGEIMKTFVALETDEGSVYIGTRYHPLSTRPGREWWRTGSSRVFHALATSIVGTRVSDNQCPLKVMDSVGREVLLRTTEDTWFLDLEFLAMLRKEGIPVREVPVTWDEHRYPSRRSKLRLSDSICAVIAMFRIRNRLSKN